MPGAAECVQVLAEDPHPVAERDQKVGCVRAGLLRRHRLGVHPDQRRPGEGEGRVRAAEGGADEDREYPEEGYGIAGGVGDNGGQSGWT